MTTQTTVAVTKTADPKTPPPTPDPVPGTRRRQAFVDSRLYRDADGGGYESAPAEDPDTVTGDFEKYVFDPNTPDPLKPFQLHEDETLSIEVLLQNSKMPSVIVDPAAEAAAKDAKKGEAERVAAANEKAAKERAEAEKEAAKHGK